MSEYPWDIEGMMLAQHNQPCDCAICDEIHRARAVRKSRGTKCFLNNDGTSDCDRMREALRKIARGTLEPGHVYLQAVRMQDIAREALAERP